MKLSLVSSLMAVAACAAPLHAGLMGTFDVGSGSKSATLQFDFENGNSWLATVRWEGSLNGFQALQMATGGVVGGQLQFQTFSFGKFVTGIGIGGDWQYGEGDLWPVENWWHYWTAEQGGGWSSSMIGAEDRVLQDGSRDAWVFGSSATPAVVPAPGAAVLAGLWGARGRRRTTAARLS